MRQAKQPPTKPLRVLGLDISSKFVGWVVFDDLEPHIHGLYRHVGVGHGERLGNYLTWLCALFEQYHPNEVVVELPFAGRRRNTFGILTLYISVTILAHYQYTGKEMPDDNKLQAREIKHLMQVQRGKDHDENKAIMVEVINRLYGLQLRFDSHDSVKKFSEDDIADAYAVVVAWLVKTKHLDPFGPKQNIPKKKAKRDHRRVRR